MNRRLRNYECEESRYDSDIHGYKRAVDEYTKEVTLIERKL